MPRKTAQTKNSVLEQVNIQTPPLPEQIVKRSPALIGVYNIQNGQYTFVSDSVKTW